MKAQRSKLQAARQRRLRHATRYTLHAKRQKLRTPHSALRADLPFVLLNMSMTADGKIATANRAVSSFGSRRDHDHLLELRATADAVMCGARTADLNQIDLGPGGAKFRRLRLKRGLAEHNLRIIVSGSGTLDSRAHIFSRQGNPPPSPPKRGALQTAPTGKFPSWEGSGVGGLPMEGDRANSPIIILTTARAGGARRARLRSVAEEVRIFGRTRLDLRAALVWLRKRWNVKRLVCEGGGELNDALFRAGLVDELIVYLAPHLLGDTARGMFDLQELISLDQRIDLTVRDIRKVGEDLRIVARVRT